MKKTFIFCFLIFLSAFSVKAQNTYQQAFTQGKNEGVALAQSVIDTFVSPNLPPKSQFTSISWSASNIISWSDAAGTHTVLGFSVDTNISQFQYDKAINNYAYTNGIYDFYYDYILDAINQNGGTNAYYNGYVEGYQEKMQGINPIDNPQITKQN